MKDRVVMIGVGDLCDKLGMEVLSGDAQELGFRTPEVNRPGLQFTGYYEHFDAKRVQLIGNAERHYLYSLTHEELMARMERFMGFPIPCIVCAQGRRPPEELIECAGRAGITVFLSSKRTGQIGHDISEYLEFEMAKKILMHGVLMDVFGVGVLLTGESSVGKSETALEMMRSGHRLVADDVVEILRAQDQAIGRAPALTRYLMEVRGIGIVDVRYLFGVGAVTPQKAIDMVIQMELWNENTDYERIGTEEHTMDILGVEVPLTVLPVRPGRNLAVIVEVAARNLRLQRLGYGMASEFKKRMGNLYEHPSEKEKQ